MNIIRWVLIVTGGVMWCSVLLVVVIVAWAWVTDPDPGYDWDAQHREAERRLRGE